MVLGHLKETITITLVLTVAGILFGGCAHKPYVKSLPHYPVKKEQVQAAAKPASPELKRMGYTVQVGAFSNIDNAIKLTKLLEKQRLDAFYFKNAAGLYRVRFGDYKSKAEAEKTAEELQNNGIVEKYHIVSPGEYIEAKGATTGKGITITGDTLRDHIAATANGFIGLPYQWGDISPTKGFDCSSLVMAVFQLNGLVVPRTSKDQFSKGIPVDPKTLTGETFFSLQQMGPGR